MVTIEEMNAVYSQEDTENDDLDNDIGSSPIGSTGWVKEYPDSKNNLSPYSEISYLLIHIIQICFKRWGHGCV